MTVLAGATRILNEEHLVEAFVRHHATMLDLHIFLDNGSTDRTLEILRALLDEGLPIQVYQSISPVFMEPVFNTGLYRLAVAAGADWVLGLDADELLDTRELPETLAAFLDGFAAEPAVRIGCRRYLGLEGESGSDPNPFKRLVRREEFEEMSKVAVRRFLPGRVIVGAGGHTAFVDSRETGGARQDRLRIAHFPERTVLQAACKAIVGWMKVVASGPSVSAKWSRHYQGRVEAILGAPGRYVQDRQGAFVRPDLPLDPVPYQGGPLRYTREPDDLARLLAQLAWHGQVLAESHGRILEEKRLIRADVLRQADQARRLF